MARGPQTSSKPARSKARKYVTALTIVSRCPACHSTERSKYEKTSEVNAIGEENGLPYDTVIWRSCQYLNCGQWRRDRSTEFRGMDT